MAADDKNVIVCVMSSFGGLRVWSPNSNRLLLGRQLYDAGNVPRIRMGDGNAIVRGSRWLCYTVTFEVVGRRCLVLQCTCPDFVKWECRGDPSCKHCVAVVRELRLQDRPWGPLCGMCCAAVAESGVFCAGCANRCVLCFDNTVNVPGSMCDSCMHLV